MKDNYLCQLAKPTRAKNALDLVLINIPEKVGNVQGFDDILKTDHKLIRFNVRHFVVFSKYTQIRRTV